MSLWLKSRAVTFCLIYHSRVSLDGWTFNKTSIVSGPWVWSGLMLYHAWQLFTGLQLLLSQKKPSSPACCFLPICLFKCILMGLIQVSSLAAHCYLLIFAFILQSVYKPQYTKGFGLGIMESSSETLSIYMCTIKTEKSRQREMNLSEL